MSIDALITEAAEKYGVDREHLYGTLEYESDGFRDITIQSQVPSATGPNGKEDSWGICQIHLPDHPEITREEAQDPAFCIPWTAEQFAAGHAAQWTAWRILYGKGR